MAYDLTQKKDRLKLLEDIHSSENKGRKAESLRQTEIFNDRIFDHVFERMNRFNDEDTVNEVPVISSINLARRISKAEASIYKNKPERMYTELNDDQLETVQKIYADMGFNSKMLFSNESFKLQNQNHLMIIPKDGKLMMRILKNHHLDSIDDDLNPEKPMGYVISQMDKNDVRRNRRREKGGSAGNSLYDNRTDVQGDFRDQGIGDRDDFKKLEERYLIWTDELNFIMNGKGDIISGDDISNPIGMVPIVDISIEKDFEYWVRQGDSLSEATIEFNMMMSDINQVVRMQGFAQAYLIAKEDVIPENLRIGPNHLLKLPAEEGSNVRPEFGFANPGADLQGSIGFAESWLSMFLTSRAQDPTTVSGSGQVNKATSGVDRLLMMIENFEASRADYDIYEKAEKSAYPIITAWHNLALGTDLLKPKYQSSNISEESEVFVKFAGPEMVKSDMDKIDMWRARIEEGEATVIDMMMDIRGLEDKEKAMEILESNSEIQKKMDELMLGDMDGNRFTNPAGNEAGGFRSGRNESGAEN